MAAVEFAGILLFIKFWNEISLVIQILAFISLLPANWFLFTLARWCIFVRRYVRIRDRRMNQLLFLLEQEEQLNYIRRMRRSPQVTLDSLSEKAEEITVT